LVCTPSEQSITGFSNRDSSDLVVIEERSGYIAMIASGDWSGEAGGHRWQRVPPNDKRNRVHTSTVTVAVLPYEDLVDRVDGYVVSRAEVTETITRGSGAGGQHRNTTDSAVRLRHDPTGTTVFIGSGRSQHENRAEAWRLLQQRVGAQQQVRQHADMNHQRKVQLGSGARGDKRRTYRTQDDTVTDHVTGTRQSLKVWMRGEW
jgi:peptide chain release factor 1